jgi:D-3-phosphoglycerate dehydrogenase (EC 1.1.1.95)
MFKVLITDPISEKGIEILKREPDIEVDNEPDISYEELLEVVKDYDCIITRSRTPVTAELLERAERLRVVGRAGVGVDNVDVEEASRRGILVINTPGANTIGRHRANLSPYAERIRNFHNAHNSMLEGKWDRKEVYGHRALRKPWA